jgi:predicted phosphodiesterase
MQTLPDGEAIAGVTTVPVRRIGLIGEDHCEKAAGSDLPQEVLDAFGDVELILHLGHMGARGSLDRLETRAPVLAIRDYSYKDGDFFITPAERDRVRGLTRVIDTGRARIGAIHNPARPPGREIATPPGGLPDLKDVPIDEALVEKFGQPVDVVAFASTHRPAAITAGGVLFVNPGSPTYPKGPGRTPGTKTPGTVGILEVTEHAVTFETVDLRAFADS